MPDLTITPTGVLKGSDATINAQSVFGETVTAGMVVYKKSTDGKWWKAQADTTPEEAGQGGLGVALNGGAVDQPAFVQTGGTITIGATVAVGLLYVVSAAAGGIAPSADLVTGNKVSLLGIGATATTLLLSVHVYGVTKG